MQTIQLNCARNACGQLFTNAQSNLEVPSQRWCRARREEQGAWRFVVDGADGVRKREKSQQMFGSATGRTGRCYRGCGGFNSPAEFLGKNSYSPILLLTIARVRSSIQQQEQSLLPRKGCVYRGGNRVHIRARRALCAAHFAQEPRIYDCRGADAGAGDWRERRDFQRGVRSAAAAASLPASGTIGTHLRRPEWTELAGCGHVRAGALGFG